MIICEVVGNIWATKKDANMEGAKLMMVRQIDYFSERESEVFVAADIVGAGIGEQVLVVSGSTARRALGRDEVPIDTVIVGIVDSIEVERDLKNRRR
jgi:ethanolamine utilization protein EutN